ncbi:MAG: GNAT family N-acetyltransferase [Gemmatimonadota bacterium]
MDAAHIRPLDWDSRHFGFPVAELAAEVGDEEELRAVLSRAADTGVHLLYWLAPESFRPTQDTLTRFGGRRVVGYRRYRRDLTHADALAESDPRCVSVLGTEPDDAMYALALLAGALSRFKLDDRISDERFEAMYRIWLERSLAGELAADVLVLRAGDGRPLSLVSYRIRDGMAEIGLVSTAPEAQKKGYGSALLTEVHRRARGAGCRAVEVATQTENRGACRLYEQAGYSVVHRGDHYHFFLASALPRGRGKAEPESPS